MPELTRSRIRRPWVKEVIQRGNNPIYQTKQWKADRKAHLDANPLCVKCQEEGIAREATVSDHIVPVEQGGDMWDWKNRQALCASHHNRKSSKEKR